MNIKKKKTELPNTASARRHKRKDFHPLSKRWSGVQTDSCLDCRPLAWVEERQWAVVPQGKSSFLTAYSRQQGGEMPTSSERPCCLQVPGGKKVKEKNRMARHTSGQSAESHSVSHSDWADCFLERAFNWSSVHRNVYSSEPNCIFKRKVIKISPIFCLFLDFRFFFSCSSKYSMYMAWKVKQC